MTYDCYCDYDQPDVYLARVISARKAHKCEECGGAIVVGEKYENVRMLFEGFWSVFKTCERCVDLRTWVKNNVPCLCWLHGDADGSCREAIEEARYRAPEETRGLWFGFLRRKVLRDRFNRARAA